MAEVKDPKKLTKDECLAELETLGETVEFEEEFSAKSPLKTLQRLVKEGRAAVAEAEDEDDEDESDEEDESEDEDEEEDEETDEDDEEAEVVESGPKGKGAHVFKADGTFVRSFTPRKHGKNFAAVAKTFVEKEGREGYRVKVTK